MEKGRLQWRMGETEVEDGESVVEKGGDGSGGGVRL